MNSELIARLADDRDTIKRYQDERGVTVFNRLISDLNAAMTAISAQPGEGEQPKPAEIPRELWSWLEAREIAPSDTDGKVEWREIVEALTEHEENLLATQPLDGVWFGDKHPTEQGRFWWRNRLEAALSAQPGEGGEDARDAARLDWLSKVARTSTLHMGGNHPWNLTGNHRLHNLRGPSLRAAIDAAMTAPLTAPGADDGQ